MSGNPAYGLAAAPPSKNIYVAGLPRGIDDARLKEVFSAYGEVIWCKVMREGRDGRVPGLIEFSNLEHATWVVANVNGGIPQGLTEPVDVKFKDERERGFGKEGGGKGGSHRFSPYGPPDSTGFDAFLAQAFAAAAGAANGGLGLGKGGLGGLGGLGVGGLGAMPRPTEPVPSDNVYVKGLPITCDEALLKQVFGAFGTVTQCRVCPGGETRKTALVRFQGVEEATLCIESCSNGQVPAGLTEPIDVRYADTWDTKQKRSSDGTEFSIEVIVKGFESSGLMPGGVGRYDNNNSCALYIAGLPSDTTDFHLFKLFSPLGPIAPRGVRALLNEDGSCKGIAFVNYQREDSVHAAIAVYNGAILPDGSKLKVQQKAQRPPPQICHPPTDGIAARVVPPPAGGYGAPAPESPPAERPLWRPPATAPPAAAATAPAPVEGGAAQPPPAASVPPSTPPPGPAPVAGAGAAEGQPPASAPAAAPAPAEGQGGAGGGSGGGGGGGGAPASDGGSQPS